MDEDEIDDQAQPIKRAAVDLGLTPQELSLYERHLGNLWGPGGRTTQRPGDDFPSRQTLYIGTEEQDGRHYLVPSIYGGEELSPQQAWRMAQEQGLDTFPSYPSREQAEARYGLLHKYMEDDTRKYFQAQGYRAGGRAQRLQQGGPAVNPLEDTGAPPYRLDMPFGMVDHAREQLSDGGMRDRYPAREMDDHGRRTMARQINRNENADEMDRIRYRRAALPDEDEYHRRAGRPVQSQWMERGEADRARRYQDGGPVEPGVQVAEAGDVRRFGDFPGRDILREVQPEYEWQDSDEVESLGHEQPAQYDFKVPYPNKNPGTPGGGGPMEYWRRRPKQERPMSIGPKGREVLAARKGGEMVRPYEQGDNWDAGDFNYAPDALESAEQHRDEQRRIRNVGRYETLKQLDRADDQKRREESSAKLNGGYQIQGFPDWHTVEEQLWEENQARDAQKKLDEFNRKFQPSIDLPGGVPGHRRGGVVGPKGQRAMRMARVKRKS